MNRSRPAGVEVDQPCQRRYFREHAVTRSWITPVRSRSPIVAAPATAGEHDAGVRCRHRPRVPLPRDRRAGDSDGVLVAFHDDDLSRTCGRPGLISELPWSEVRTARVDGEEPIPLFEDLLTTFPTAGSTSMQDRCRRPTTHRIVAAHGCPRSGVRGLVLACPSPAPPRCAGPRLCTSMSPIEVARWRFGIPRRRKPCGLVAQVPLRRASSRS